MSCDPFLYTIGGHVLTCKKCKHCECDETTEIICILDRSGSMGHLRMEVINSFNSFIEEQKEMSGKARVTLVLFDDKIEMPFMRVKLKKFKDIDEEIYYVRGMTSLNDAIGKTLNHDLFVGKKKAIVLIQTDGGENSSKDYSNARVKTLVEKKQALGWDFLFLGANIDTFSVGSSYGFQPNQMMNYVANKSGINTNSVTMSVRSTAYRSN